MLPKNLEDWLSQAVAQLRSRRAGAAVREELAQHLADQYQALLETGMNPDTAAEKTVQQMGDPVLVGGQLDRVHRPRPALVQLVPVALLLTAGSLLQWVLSRYVAGTINGQAYWFGFSGSIGGTLFTIILSLAALGLAARFLDISLFERYAWAIYLGYFAVGGYLLGFSPSNGGSSLGAAMGLLFVPVWTGVLYRQRGKYLAGLVITSIAVLPGLLLCVLALKAEFAVLVGLCCFALCIWCCAKNWFGLGARLSAGMVVLGVVLGMIALVLFCLDGMPLETLLQRLALRLDPAADPQGAGYLSIYLEGMHRCTRLVGQGMDPTLLDGAFSAYPEGFAHSPLFTRGSWMLSYLAWRFGLLAAGALAAIAAAGLALLWRAALRCRNLLGRLLAVGCALLLTAGMLANLLGNLWLPVSGFLPFLGWGGVMRCTEALLAGLLLSAFRLDPITTGQPVNSVLPRAVCYQDGVLSIRLHR